MRSILTRRRYHSFQRSFSLTKLCQAIMAQVFLLGSSSQRGTRKVMAFTSRRMAVRFPKIRQKSLRRFGSTVLPSFPVLAQQQYASRLYQTETNDQLSPGKTSSRDTTVGDVVKDSIVQLEASNVDDAQDSVFNLLAHVLGLSWERGFVELRNAHYSNSRSDASLMSRIMTESEREHWNTLLSRRLQHEPIQYILGQWDFLDYTLRIRPPLLCPRPETEELMLLVSQTIQQMNKEVSAEDRFDGNPPLHVLDVGCGTGCIGVSLAAMHPNLHVTAIDVDPVAIETSMENAQRILDSTNVNRYKAHLVAAADFEIPPTAQGFDLVVSNPPYIPPKDMDTLDATVRNYENHGALSGIDPDGMQIIRQIVHQLPFWCRHQAGKKGDKRQQAFCWMEVDPTHPALLEEYLPLLNDDVTAVVSYRQTVQDLQGKDRFVMLEVAY